MAAPNGFLFESISEDKLVAIWEEYPCLYDDHSEAFRNRDLRDQAVQRIAEETGQNADWVKNKIRQLRNSYGKAQKTAAGGSARKQVTKRTAWIMERLQFLAPFVGGRETVCNRDVTSPTSSQDSLDGDEDTQENPSSRVAIAHLTEEGPLNLTSMPKSTKLPVKPRQKSLKKKRDEEEYLVIQGLANSITDRNENKKAKVSGGCTSYVTYLGETLEKLDDRTRYIAQHEISNILFQAQMGTLSRHPQQHVFPMQQTQMFPDPTSQTQSSPSPTSQTFPPPDS